MSPVTSGRHLSERARNERASRRPYTACWIPDTINKPPKTTSNRLHTMNSPFWNRFPQSVCVLYIRTDRKIAAQPDKGKP